MKIHQTLERKDWRFSKPKQLEMVTTLLLMLYEIFIFFESFLIFLFSLGFGLCPSHLFYLFIVLKIYGYDANNHWRFLKKKSLEVWCSNLLVILFRFIIASILSLLQYVLYLLKKLFHAIFIQLIFSTIHYC